MTSLHTLRDAAVSSTTSLKYKSAVAKFIHHSSQQLSSIEADDYDSLDHILSQYFELLYARNGSYSEASCTLYGLCLFIPSLTDRRMLCDAKLRLKGWRRLAPSTSYPPMTFEVVAAICANMISKGQIEHAIATFLSFECYLRISEFSNLTINDILIPMSDSRSTRTHNVVVCLARTKTGRNQSVTVRNGPIADIVVKFVKYKRDMHHASSTSQLFSFSTAAYRTAFRESCDDLHLSHIGYTPHSLRHGGATLDSQRGIPIADIKTRGRWRDTKSAERYIQTGVALLRLYDVPVPVYRLGCQVVDQLGTYLDACVGHFLRMCPGQ